MWQLIFVFVFILGVVFIAWGLTELFFWCEKRDEKRKCNEFATSFDNYVLSNITPIRDSLLMQNSFFNVPDNTTQLKPVERVERGWAGHYIGADSCRFRRNTLLTCGNTRIVVSTVGLYYYDNEFKPIGIDNRYFETMAFHSESDDTRYYDADVTRQISFDSPWAISEIDADDKANDMHEAVVAEITEKLSKGLIT
jgi:hypothetical protein